MSYTPLELAKAAAFAADEKKATDIALLHVGAVADVCEYFLICSGSNSRQVDTIVDAVREKVSKNFGLSPFSCEGREGLNWVLVDYGPVVVHVFNPETRDYYRLERLWGEAPRVELDLEGAAPLDGPVAADELPVFSLDPEDLEDNLPESADPVE